MFEQCAFFEAIFFKKSQTFFIPFRDESIKLVDVQLFECIIAYQVQCARCNSFASVLAKQSNTDLGAAVERVKIGKVNHSGSFAVFNPNDKACLALGVEILLALFKVLP